MLDWAKTKAYNVHSNIFNRKDMTELKKLLASPRDESPSSDGCSWVELPRVHLSSQDAFLSQDSEKSEKKSIKIWLAYPFKWGHLIFFNMYSFVVCVCVVCTCEHNMTLMGRLEDKLQESVLVLSFSHRVSLGAQTQGRKLSSKHLDCYQLNGPWVRYRGFRVLHQPSCAWAVCTPATAHGCRRMVHACPQMCPLNKERSS